MGADNHRYSPKSASLNPAALITRMNISNAARKPTPFALMLLNMAHSTINKSNAPIDAVISNVDFFIGTSVDMRG